MSISLNCPICSAECKISSESYEAQQIFRWWQELGYKFSHKVLDHYKDSGKTTLFKCPRCRFGMFYPLIVGIPEFYQDLSRLGKSWYYQEEKWEYRQALRDLNACCNVLDIGCGKGFFLEKLRQEGKEVHGIEHNVEAVEFARSRGLSVETITIEHFAVDHSEIFDGVCLFQVLEHVESPVELLTCTLSCLRPGGLLVIGVPNAAGILSRTGPMVSEVPPHHVSRWTADTLVHLAKHFELVVQKIKCEPFHHYDWLRLIWAETLRNSLPDRIRSIAPIQWMQNAGNLALRIPIKVLYTLIPDGLDFIAGHSLYAVFKKV
jgi:2-polyprenyl-3-methyl-5-hydroxy-6-metoxy-1,4-benzoquinol methylase